MIMYNGSKEEAGWLKRGKKQFSGVLIHLENWVVCQAFYYFCETKFPVRFECLAMVKRTFLSAPPDDRDHFIH